MKIRPLSLHSQPTNKGITEVLQAASWRLFYVSWWWNLFHCSYQLYKLRRGLEVNLRQAENVVFFLSLCLLHTATLIQTPCTHTFKSRQKNTYATPALFHYVWVGGEGRWGKLIFLLREIDVICSALHCLRMI